MVFEEGIKFRQKHFTSLAYDWILVVSTSLYEVGGLIGE